MRHICVVILLQSRCRSEHARSWESVHFRLPSVAFRWRRSGRGNRCACWIRVWSLRRKQSDSCGRYRGKRELRLRYWRTACFPVLVPVPCSHGYSFGHKRWFLPQEAMSRQLLACSWRSEAVPCKNRCSLCRMGVEVLQSVAGLHSGLIRCRFVRFPR